MYGQMKGTVAEIWQGLFMLIYILLELSFHVKQWSYIFQQSMRLIRTLYIVSVRDEEIWLAFSQMGLIIKRKGLIAFHLSFSEKLGGGGSDN